MTALRNEQGADPLSPDPITESGTGDVDWVRAAIGASGDILYRWDILSDRLSWAGEVEDVLGEGEQAIASGHGFNNRIHPEDLPRRLKALSDHFSQGDTYDCEYRIRNAQGVVIWVHDRGRVEIDGNGMPRAMAGAMRIITQRKQNEARLERIANYDELTGHFNRARLRDEVEHALSFSRRFRVEGGFLVIGVDKLAMVNNAYGYEIGDAVLVAIGQRLDRVLRASDVIGRLGGDRFGVLLTNCPEDCVSTCMDRIIDVMRDQAIEINGQSIPITVSIGCVLFPGLVNTAYEVMTKAESALAYAKKAGRCCANIYRPSEQQTLLHRRALDMGNQVQQAMREQRLIFTYQPIVAAQTLTVSKYECLLRMKDARGEIVPAGAFIPVVEQLGMTRLMDRYVLDMTVEELRRDPQTVLSLNISGLTATDQSWLRALIAAVKSTPAIAERLIVEITETAALHDIEESARFVNVVRDVGCRVAIDDFGAGFTSFRHLKALTVDLVKIDGSFVRNLANNADQQLFIRNLMGLAGTFGLETVAEFVENEADAKVLIDAGVHYLQGYYYGRPQFERPWAIGAKIQPV
ncbi:putative bifunctional diguanylate cyclase/phosphodiesterase [Dongia sp.]|uniref:putative bifunctional diguanylate cyclase/phosphodiesterase n=1 Tax=Dongia sp. TaxID=1977262 RepID=UPI0035AE84DE